jgi:hypothetical protein
LWRTAAKAAPRGSQAVFPELKIGRCLLRGQFNGLAIFDFALPPDAGQLSRLKIRMVLQNPKRIATRYGGVMARVAGKNDPTVLPQVIQQFHVVNHGAKNVDKTLSHCRASEKSFSATRADDDDHDNSPK